MKIFIDELLMQCDPAVRDMLGRRLSGSSMQPAGHDKQHGTGGTASRPCKKRKDGAPAFQIGKDKVRKAGPPGRQAEG